jgi:hypothetical protein
MWVGYGVECEVVDACDTFLVSGKACEIDVSFLRFGELGGGKRGQYFNIEIRRVNLDLNGGPIAACREHRQKKGCQVIETA